MPLQNSNKLPVFQLKSVLLIVNAMIVKIYTLYNFYNPEVRRTTLGVD